MKYYYKIIDEKGEIRGLCESSDGPLSNFEDTYTEIPYEEYLKIQEEKGMI